MNQLNAEKDKIFGKDRHRMKELSEKGVFTARNGGVWETDLSDLCELIGIRYQTNFMRKMAIQYGSYFFTCDGTFCCNKYKLTTCPMITADCLGLSHCCGVSIGVSENKVDITKAIEAFLLSSRLEESEEFNVSI